MPPSSEEESLSHSYAVLLAEGAARYAEAGHYGYARRLCLRAAGIYARLAEMKPA